MVETANLLRREVVETAETFVVKVGTSVLSRDDDTLDADRIASLCEQVVRVLDSGRRVVVVSSGAIGAGMSLLGLAKRPDDLPHLQAAAATGQAHLIRLYDDSLRRHGRHAAQMLLTADDFQQRGRYLNVQNTLNTLFELGAVPIVNENDTVSIEEIEFGDNDLLAAMVSHLVPGPLLVLLSVVDGLFDGDPHGAANRVIPLVDRFDDSLWSLARGERSRRGKGGMHTKLEAIRLVTAAGQSALLVNGTRPHVLDDLLAGHEVGTLFLATDRSVPARKRWIGYTVEPKGSFRLDAGARVAIERHGRSLLAAGITAVEGEFAKGDLVALLDPSGQEFARGLSNYDSRDATTIAGQRTAAIALLLGSVPYAEVIHRDNLVVTV